MNEQTVCVIIICYNSYTSKFIIVISFISYTCEINISLSLPLTPFLQIPPKDKNTLGH